MTLKSFTQFFGGKYMKFWYAACFVVLIVIALRVYNNDSVSRYSLIIYNDDGSVKTEETVDKVFVSRELSSLPVTKKFIPMKLF